MLKVNRAFEELTPEGAYLVLDKANELERQGKDIIHLEIGQPDFPTPNNIVFAGVSALQKGQTKYTSPLGILPLRERLAEIHGVTTDQVAITPSGKTAIFVAMSAILEKGDHVYYPNPGFPTYRALIEYLGCIPQDKITKDTKLIIINSPSNPTGKILSKSEMEIIKKNDCWVITDEMYSEIVYQEYQSYYDMCEREKTILVNGFSKTYSMTGWRIGYMAFPERLKSSIECFLTHTVGCTATFTQIAALEALNGDKKPIARMIFEFEKRRDFLVEGLNNIPGIVCPMPLGAFYVFPKIMFPNMTCTLMSNYLLENGVAVLPGKSFGAKGNGHIRISYATSMENLKEGIRRIKVALEYL